MKISIYKTIGNFQKFWLESNLALKGLKECRMRHVQVNVYSGEYRKRAIKLLAERQTDGQIYRQIQVTTRDCYWQEQKMQTINVLPLLPGESGPRLRGEPCLLVPRELLCGRRWDDTDAGSVGVSSQLTLLLRSNSCQHALGSIAWALHVWSRGLRVLE